MSASYLHASGTQTDHPGPFSGDGEIGSARQRGSIMAPTFTVFLTIL